MKQTNRNKRVSRRARLGSQDSAKPANLADVRSENHQNPTTPPSTTHLLPLTFHRDWRPPFTAATMSLTPFPATTAVPNLCLRLHLHRHNFPILKILWSPPPDAGAYYAVSDLLRSINSGASLETDTLALEDYGVEKDGCIVFHFMKVFAVFRDGDEVT